MKLKNIYIIAILLTIGLVSCDSDDNATGHSNVNFTAPTATYAIIGNNLNLNVDESLRDPAADEQDVVTGIYKYGVFIVEATIPEAVQFDTYIDLTQTGGTASSSDFEVERIKIPALQTTGTGKITILRTGDLEGDETLVISSNTNSTNINGTQDFTFEINNDYLNDNLELTIDWCGEYDFEYEVAGGVTGHLTGDLGDSIDIDVAVYDSAFTNIDSASAGTASCPEVCEFEGLADGTYYVVIDVYANSLASYGLNESLNLKLSYEQEHFIDTTTLLHNMSLTSDSSGQLGVVALVTKTGNSFSVVAF